MPFSTEAETRDLAIGHIAKGVALLGAIVAIGVIGYMLAGWPLIDALYMVIITIFGVGYGEVTPSPNLEPGLVRESLCPGWGLKGFSDEEATQCRADRGLASAG